jgi:hypothetical protein
MVRSSLEWLSEMGGQEEVVVEKQIPPLRFASVGMTGRVLFLFRANGVVMSQSTPETSTGCLVAHKKLISIARA